MIRSLIEDCIRPLSGPLGKKLRYWYYKKRFASCGKNLFIETGVYFFSCTDIIIGDNCWIDKNCVLIAGYMEKPNLKIKNNVPAGKIVNPGKLVIGNNAHIGIGTVLQAHGGINIGDYFTSSAHCRVFSLSNDPYASRRGTIGEANDTAYVMTPVCIGRNVWLGLNVSVVGAYIENDVFIKPHSCVTKQIAANSVAEGSPAEEIRSRFDT